MKIGGGLRAEGLGEGETEEGKEAPGACGMAAEPGATGQRGAIALEG